MAIRKTGAKITRTRRLKIPVNLVLPPFGLLRIFHLDPRLRPFSPNFETGVFLQSFVRGQNRKAIYTFRENIAMALFRLLRLRMQSRGDFAGEGFCSSPRTHFPTGHFLGLSIDLLFLYNRTNNFSDGASAPRLQTGARLPNRIQPGKA